MDLLSLYFGPLTPAAVTVIDWLASLGLFGGKPG
jgi:hypothetical protein